MKTYCIFCNKYVARGNGVDGARLEVAMPRQRDFVEGRNQNQTLQRRTYRLVTSTSIRPSGFNAPSTTPETLCCLKTRISSRITSISSSEYKKSPVRGRIIIINGTSTELWMALRRPRLGVVPPPTPRFPQTSSLSAPPRTALRKDQSR